MRTLLTVVVLVQLSCWRTVDTGARVEPPAVRARIAVGEDHACFIRDDGALRCWGGNAVGQLGDGTGQDHPRPVDVRLRAAVLDVGAGSSSTCALLADHTVWCWGSGDAGQLGVQGVSAAMLPVQVAGIADAVQLCASTFYNCALLRDHTVSCWGTQPDNTSSTPPAAPTRPPATRHIPARIAGLDHVGEVRCGLRMACARLLDGTVRCWGGESARFAQGTTPPPSGIVAVTGVSQATSLGVGALHACALTRSHAVSCWGDNGLSQISSGPQGSFDAPTLLDLSPRAELLAVGPHSTCVIAPDRSVLCRGVGYSGEMAHSQAPALPALPASLGGNLVELSIGNFFVCGVQQGGQVVCWGGNSRGQLGSRCHSESCPPTVVAGLND